MKFTINTVTFLVILLATVFTWIGAEWYHRRNSIEVPQDLVRHANTPLPSSFDSETLKKLYESKEKFYEATEQ